MAPSCGANDSLRHVPHKCPSAESPGGSKPTTHPSRNHSSLGHATTTTFRWRRPSRGILYSQVVCGNASRLSVPKRLRCRENRSCATPPEHSDSTRQSFRRWFDFGSARGPAPHSDPVESVTNSPAIDDVWSQVRKKNTGDEQTRSNKATQRVCGCSPQPNRLERRATRVSRGDSPWHHQSCNDSFNCDVHKGNNSNSVAD